MIGLQLQKSLLFGYFFWFIANVGQTANIGRSRSDKGKAWGWDWLKILVILLICSRTGATSSQHHTSLSTFTEEDKVNQMIESKTQTKPWTTIHEEEVNEKDTIIDANTDADTNINTNEKDTKRCKYRYKYIYNYEYKTSQSGLAISFNFWGTNKVGTEDVLYKTKYEYKTWPWRGSHDDTDQTVTVDG